MRSKSLCKNCIVVILGPSGSGKDTVINRMEEIGMFECCVRVTTREPREDNKGTGGHDPKDLERHIFVDEDDFEPDTMIMPNYYAGHWYGIPLEKIEEAFSKKKIPILKGVVDNITDLRKQMSEVFPDSNVRVIYIFPDSIWSWKERIKGRGVYSNTKERIRESIREMKQARKSLDEKDGVIDIGIINGHNQPTPEVVLSIMQNLCQDCPAPKTL